MSNNSKVLITKEKLDSIANGVAVKSGVPVTMTIDDIIQAVDSIVRPEGNLNINKNGTYDITRYETVQVDAASELTTASVKSTTNQQTIKPPNGYDGFSKVTVQPITTETLYVTPTKSQQILFPNDNVDYFDEVNVGKIPDEYTIPTGTIEIAGSGVYQVKDYSGAIVTPNTTNINITPSYNTQEYIPGTYISYFVKDDCSKSQPYSLNSKIISSFTSGDICYVVGTIKVPPNTIYNINNVILWPLYPSVESIEFSDTYWFSINGNSIKFNINVNDVNLRFYKLSYDGYSKVIVNGVNAISKTVTPTKNTQRVCSGELLGTCIANSVNYGARTETSILVTDATTYNNSNILCVGSITIDGISEDIYQEVYYSDSNPSNYSDDKFSELPSPLSHCGIAFGSSWDTSHILLCVKGEYTSYSVDLRLYGGDEATFLSEVTINPIPSNYIIPTGSTSITTNGTHNVSQYSSAVVNVSSEPTIEPLSVTTNGTYTAPSGVDGYSPVTVNVSGGGGIGTLITTKSFKNISCSSTTGEEVGTVSLAQLQHKDYDLLIIETSADTPETGKLIATVGVIMLYGSQGYAMRGQTLIPKGYWTCFIYSTAQTPSRAVTTAYGIYPNSVSFPDGIMSISMFAKYSSTYTHTIDGDYTTRVYGVNLYDLIGG